MPVSPHMSMLIFYLAGVLGAVAVLMIMPGRGYSPAKLGALLGASTLGGLWLITSQSLPAFTDTALGRAGWLYYYIFSFIAVVAAVRVITHRKPVFAALWFVMVILASSGLFIVLSADFMAFALIIIYGGAILVTYVFVIMLASRATDPNQPEDAPEYDRIAREPVAAVTVGFLLLAVILGAVFAPLKANPAAAAISDQVVADEILTERTGNRITQRLGDQLPQPPLANVERVGLDLFESHPLGIELAGVVLLVSLVGAVVIARKHVEEPTLDEASDNRRAG